jgi:L-aminopeptidase/D-esterase-like protein
VRGEFGASGVPLAFPDDATALHHKGQLERASTTIGVVATDARLTKAEAKRLAVMTHDGFARALWPSHTPMDGDAIFAIATGRSEAAVNMIEVGSAGAACMARAIARGIFEATPAPGDLLPTWRERFGA